ncbi:hypothetical protein [Halorubrum lacusprofundi]|jgi:hypothetical protein|uniref:Uncharacterized protein n=1 Tax=Halorubrum lacusprofundi (strain ATCC 49239 / DSM 5036 / JCM 8891 / ACAM 34) TaxID=416348 RepID=B9LRG5_HALLT|nr:hypothetical protein [Halorubrum lacusprofundi]ACM55788.1 conserved hypothetical protein [Halorubrum lacusprofundi ATCC 49239]MCG1006658.1 hypothetical protein [Halorubrum lacusprofundi]
MVSTAAVKQALSALASRTDTATRPSVAVIDEADAARSDLRRAAGFVDSGGLDRLDEAIAAAERAGDEAAAERGREARAAFRRFREAAADSDNRGGDDRAGDDRACDDERGR